MSRISLIGILTGMLGIYMKECNMGIGLGLELELGNTLERGQVHGLRSRGNKICSLGRLMRIRGGADFIDNSRHGDGFAISDDEPELSGFNDPLLSYPFRTKKKKGRGGGWEEGGEAESDDYPLEPIDKFKPPSASGLSDDDLPSDAEKRKGVDKGGREEDALDEVLKKYVEDSDDPGDGRLRDAIIPTKWYKLTEDGCGSLPLEDLAGPNKYMQPDAGIESVFGVRDIEEKKPVEDSVDEMQQYFLTFPEVTKFKPRQVRIKMPDGSIVNGTQGVLDPQPDPCLLETPTTSDSDIQRLPDQDYRIDPHDEDIAEYLFIAKHGTNQSSPTLSVFERKLKSYTPAVMEPKTCLFSSWNVSPLYYSVTVIAHPKTREAVIIDPGGDWYKIWDMCRRNDFIVKGILLTNAFFFKSNAIEQLYDELGHPPIYLHKDDKNLWDRRLEQPNFLSDWEGAIHYVRPIQGPSHWVSDGDPVPLGGRVIHIPGISSGSVAYYFPDFRLAVVGDSLRKGMVGHCEWPVSDHHRLVRSIKKKILTLPVDTKLVCSEGPLSTVGIERAYNDFQPTSAQMIKQRFEDEIDMLERHMEGRFFTEEERLMYKDDVQQELKASLEPYVEGTDPNYISKLDKKKKERAKRWAKAGYFPDSVNFQADDMVHGKTSVVNRLTDSTSSDTVRRINEDDPFRDTLSSDPEIKEEDRQIDTSLEEDMEEINKLLKDDHLDEDPTRERKFSREDMIRSQDTMGRNAVLD
ncbi:hypothetical protein AAMO2058_001625900 [Amorphochlora amoebiformis]